MTALGDHQGRDGYEEHYAAATSHTLNGFVG